MHTARDGGGGCLAGRACLDGRGARHPGRFPQRLPGADAGPDAPGRLAVHDPGEVTGTLTGPCRARAAGQLPDPSCTRGSVDPAVTQTGIGATICRPGGYTDSVRPPEADTERFKYDEAYPAYAVPAGAGTELDHLVPLELGGSNDAANLWPEIPASPNPKDQVEDALHDAVCAGRVPLAAAQAAIAADWMTAESRLGLGQPAAVASSAPVPVSTPPAAPPSHPPAAPPSHPPALAAAGGCYPRSNEGTCYRPGEYCRASDHGADGRTAGGEPIACRDNDGWRWEPA